MCMVGDEDYWHWYTEKRPTALKQHQCGECSRTIERGEQYVTQGGVHDGSFVWHKTCIHCDIASWWLVTACDGWIFTRRQEDFFEHVVGHEKYLRSRPLTRLLRWMAAGWRDRDGNLRSVEDVSAITDEAIAIFQRRYERAVA